MRTRLVYQQIDDHPGYGAGEGTLERLEYECPCGKGRILEEHDNIPGFRDHDVSLLCGECSKKYILDVTNGVRGWELVEK